MHTLPHCNTMSTVPHSLLHLDVVPQTMQHKVPNKLPHSAGLQWPYLSKPSHTLKRHSAYTTAFIYLIPDILCDDVSPIFDQSIIPRAANPTHWISLPSVKESMNRKVPTWHFSVRWRQSAFTQKKRGVSVSIKSQQTSRVTIQKLVCISTYI